MEVDIGSALMSWMLMSTFLHELGHSFMAKVCGCKTIGFYSQPIPGVILEHPKNKKHSILVLAGGWIFGMLSILLFLPFVDANYVTTFLAASFIVHTVLSMLGDGVGIIAILKFGVLETWSYFSKGLLKIHKKLEKVGLSRIMVINRKLWKKLTEETKIFPKYSIGFVDQGGFKKWISLISILGLVSVLLISLVNWPVFWLLSLFGIEILVDFSIVFCVVLGVTLSLIALERVAIER